MASIVCGSCKDRHQTVREVKDCYADADEARAEVYAESVMSWVMGGGDQAGARVYASVIASGKTWPEYLAEQDEAFAREVEAAGTCEHGLSAALCCGPGHYPMDDPSDF
jgi:hypothetical protein